MKQVGSMKEKVMQAVFLIAACASVLAFVLICVFLFANGIPAVQKIGIFKFLLGKTWKPGNDIYGIWPMILGSIYVTAGAVITGVPIGILTAVFMAEYCPKKIYRVLKSATELLAGIPSIIWFFWIDGIDSANPSVISGENQWAEYSDSITAFRHDDPANHYRCKRIGDSSSSKTVL